MMTNEEIRRELRRGSGQFAQIREVLEAIRAEQARQREMLHAVQADTAATKDVVEAWNAIKTGGKFLKWVAGVIASAAVVWATVKVGISRWM